MLQESVNKSRTENNVCAPQVKRNALRFINVRCIPLSSQHIEYSSRVTLFGVYSGTFVRGLKRPEYGTDHSCPSNVWVKNVWGQGRTQGGATFLQPLPKLKF